MKINMFSVKGNKLTGRTHNYDFLFDIDNDIKVLEELKQKVKEPQILCYTGLDCIDFYTKTWKIVKEYEHINPYGRENGRDGYIDADYQNENGVIVRMVSRDVFDFGCYSYPKRVEGTEDIFSNDIMTEEEKSLCKWLSEFGEFSGIRM